MRALLVGVSAWATFSTLVAYVLGRTMRPPRIPEAPVDEWSDFCIDAMFAQIVAPYEVDQ